MNTFKVIIAGSRTFIDYKKLEASMDYYLKDVKKTKKIIIVSGGARGADKLGEQYAKSRKYQIEMHIPDWDNLGKRAGMVRNKEMANAADALVAFYDGSSRGTKNMIDEMKKLNKSFRVVKF